MKSKNMKIREQYVTVKAGSVLIVDISKNDKPKLAEVTLGKDTTVYLCDSGTIGQSALILGAQ